MQSSIEGTAGKKVFFALVAVASAAVYASSQLAKRKKEADRKKREEYLIAQSPQRRESLEHLMKSGVHLESLMAYKPELKGPKGFQPAYYEEHQLTAVASSSSTSVFRSTLPASLAYDIFTFCEYHDVVKCQSVCKNWRMFLAPLKLDRTYLKSCARRGFPDHIRGHTWYSIAQAKPVTAKKRNMYASLLEQKSPIADEIERDVGRTLIHYTAIGNEEDAVALLTNLLKAYAIHDEEEDPPSISGDMGRMS